MVTKKTLKYSHKKTCSGEEEKPKPIKQSHPIQNHDQEPINTPKLVRTISRVVPQQPTVSPLEMMREHRNQQRTERLQMRQDKMSSLFTNSI
jgi:hypothetical protein